MISVAIDGPGGAGKSTIAKAAASSLSFIYVDTGALYRSIGYSAISLGVDVADEQAVAAVLPQLNIEIKYVDGSQHVFVNGEDLGEKIRTPEISMAASKVSKYKSVRAFLLDLQRDFAKKYNVIMDGRDIGTVVLPNASLKIYLTASAESRAQRRYKELCEKGESVDYQSVLDDLNCRDYEDTHREIAPLKKADNAKLLDTSNMTLEESINAVIDMIKAVMSECGNGGKLTNGHTAQTSAANETLQNSDTGLTFKLKTGRNWLTTILKIVVYPIYRLLFRYSLEGKENIPKKGGCIFCSNHVSALDPAFWVIALPRRVHFMAKEELFKNPIGGRFLRALDVFAIKRGSRDMSSINFASDLVKNGELLGIYPEGTRSKDGKPGRAKSGIAFIANATGADVIPAAIICKDNKKIVPFRRFKMVIGKPIPHSEIAFDTLAKDNLKRVSTRIMSEITKIWEENQF